MTKVKINAEINMATFFCRQYLAPNTHEVLQPQHLRVVHLLFTQSRPVQQSEFLEQVSSVFLHAVECQHPGGETEKLINNAIKLLKVNNENTNLANIAKQSL